MVMTEINAHWPTSFGLVGLYLILIAVVKLTENLVDWEVLLDDRVMAIGQGLAYSYYYGFLKIILPATENGPSKSKRGSVCIIFTQYLLLSETRHQRTLFALRI